MLNSTGMGDNPMLVRLSVKLADLISPDVFERNSTGAESEKSDAQKLYPSMQK